MEGIGNATLGLLSDDRTALLACRPLMPPAEQLLPYLQRADRARRYSNHGELVLEFERRLASLLRVERDRVVSASSGTAALVGAILGTAGRARPERPLALCPSYTFVATASALEQCGYTPYLLDVDADTWQLDPVGLARHPMIERAGLVVPVAVYGRPIDQAPWCALSEQSGVAVVIDGATSIEALARSAAWHAGRIPVALSFHATKAFSTGEGGAVIGGDAASTEQIFRALNFGFLGNRESLTASINGKMSEYHAAVGLVQCDSWAARRAAFAGVADRYRSAFGAAGLGARFRGAPDIASNYALFQFDDAATRLSAQRLLEHDHIESRLWYGPGLHRQPYYAALPGDRLPVTDALAACLLGLPMAQDLRTGDVERVVSCVARAMAGD